MPGCKILNICELNFQNSLKPLMTIRKKLNVPDSLSVNVADVILRSYLNYYWTFSGFNVNFERCQLESLQLAFMKNDDHSENTTQIPIITFNNSSFKSLDLHPKTRAEITDCYIDAKKKLRPTLITSNNSDIMIQNSTFLRFVKKHGPLILDAQINCSVSVENSLFAEHRSEQSVLFVHDNSSMKVSNTIFRENTVFLRGGAISIQRYSRLNVTNCLFDDNFASKKGGAVYGDIYVILEMKNINFHNNHASSSHGGAIAVSTDVKLLVRNCTLDGNSAVSGDALSGSRNVTLEIYKTKFNNNHATSFGGAIHLDRKVQVLLTNCTLNENSAGRSGGAIYGLDNVKLGIDKSNFIRNALSPDVRRLSTGADIFIRKNSSLEVRYTFIFFM